jgi:catechol 2,3-dioxygenase-like lactoylglutathione lyase family enzyme
MPVKGNAMQKVIISGIQQIGIGVENRDEAWSWYRKAFGMRVPVFEDAGEAPYMTHYTGGTVHSRTAVLAANLQGGSAFEIWQYTSRKPQPPSFTPAIGDLGIVAARIKTPDIGAALDYYRKNNIGHCYEPVKDPAGNQHFFLYDPYGNLFQIVPDSSWFLKPKHPTGGVAGCMIGVSDIEAALPLYQDILGFDRISYDEKGSFYDLKDLPGGERRVRRVLLTNSRKRQGAFSRLFGDSAVELVQLLDDTPRTILKDRYWGDLGFIHLCFDIRGMGGLGEQCREAGFPFTVDSKDSFDMGEASGRFTYIEDPDGTLIEFVETNRMPILKKVGWYLDLNKRNPAKPLPDFLLKALKLTEVKD